MIAKQYKNGTIIGVERGKNGFGTGSRTSLERGIKRVGTGAKTGFKWEKNGISPNSTIWNDVEQPFSAVPHLPSLFFAVPSLFSPVFDDFHEKPEKKVVKKWKNGKGKNAFLSSFFPIPVFSLSFPGTSLPTCCASRCSTGAIVPHSSTGEHGSLHLHSSLLWWYNKFHRPKR